MSIEMPDFDANIREAVRAFWGNREAARRKQVESGKADQGERSSVTAGKNMDGFLAIVRQLRPSPRRRPGPEARPVWRTPSSVKGFCVVWAEKLIKATF